MSIRPSHIVKLLQSVTCPVYLLNGDGTLIFCNRALEEWTGCEAKSLVGQVLRYHTPVSRLRHEMAAAALCPPPAVLGGAAGLAVLSMDQISRVSRRKTEFLPLSLGEGRWAVLALIDTEEWDESRETSDTSERRSPAWTETVTSERFEAAELHRTLLSLRRRLGEPFQSERVLGTSPAMQLLRRQVDLAIASTVPVLILGESGCGKEHIARSVHFGRASQTPGALVPLDCRVLSSELIASTMRTFHQRFRNDPSPRRHTLLLQDADLLPSEILPLLEDWCASPLANLRIVATSPLAMEDWGEKRELFFLLGTLLLEVPPLRRRREEIPLLAQMFLEARNGESTKQLPGFTSDALDRLGAYHWPGNIDELDATVASAWEKTASGLIPSSNLPMRLHDAADAAAHPVVNEDIVPLESFLEDVERELLERALRKAGGNKSRAAQLLSVSRPKLYRRLEWFGLLDPGKNENPPEDRKG